MKLEKSDAKELAPVALGLVIIGFYSMQLLIGVTLVAAGAVYMTVQYIKDK